MSFYDMKPANKGNKPVSLSKYKKNIKGIGVFLFFISQEFRLSSF